MFVMGSEAARRIAKAHADFDIIVVEPGTNGHFRIWIEETLRQSVEIDAATAASDDVRYF